MSKNIYLIGMARSGTYAIANWMLGENWPQKIKFHDSMKSYDHYFVKQPKKGYHLFRYERDSLRGFHRYSKLHKNITNDGLIFYIIRDPYNHFASIIKLWESFPKKKKKKHNMWPLEKAPTRRVVNGWKEFAKQALGKYNYLPTSSVCVNYNQWFSDQSYRIDLTKRLGCKFSDSRLQEVKSFKNPNQKLISSFDKQKYNGRAQSMQVLERWRYYEHNALYRSMFDREIIDYATSLFFSPPFDIGGVV